MIQYAKIEHFSIKREFSHHCPVKTIFMLFYTFGCQILGAAAAAADDDDGDYDVDCSNDDGELYM